MDRQDSGEGQTQGRPEARWPVVLAVLMVLVLLQALPARIRLLPVWFPYLASAGSLLPVLYWPKKQAWQRVVRAMAVTFVLLIVATMLVSLGYLILAIVRRPAEVSGLQLLTSSVGGWVTNVMVFSLLYWYLDGGGPLRRASGSGELPDWLFPQAGVSELVPRGWRPMFVDYLFLSFSTATAFSTTDVIPLTARAKLLMMAESAISLVTLVVTAARAINTLGG